jgi:hypothetical protein
MQVFWCYILDILKIHNFFHDHFCVKYDNHEKIKFIFPFAITDRTIVSSNDKVIRQIVNIFTYLVSNMFLFKIIM